ncbi:DUF2490 domain-containing protein [Spirosoma endophyticum]|nr:DUF2490 domain-containing protein [Spirosoma endophyticum]
MMHPLAKIFLSRRLVVSGLLGLLSIAGYSQNRVLDHNAIGWYVYNGDHKLSKRWALHTEYQWRRIDLIRSWQQSLARLGLIRKVSDRVSVSAGYTYFTTYPYGRYPQADAGVPYPEHRLYEDLKLNDTLGRLKLTHRFRLEQRWLGTLADQNPREVAQWDFQHRIRYQISGEFPLQGNAVDDGEFYVNFFDELFIGFGRKVEQNIFNQNRLSGGIGYQISDNVKLELNFLNQVVQHAEADPVTGNPIFEINNGFRLNLNYNLDFSKGR